MQKLIVFSLLGLTSLALGQSRVFPLSPNSQSEPTPPTAPTNQPTAVTAAKTKYGDALKAAHDNFLKAQRAADQDYVDALTSAVDVAAKAGSPKDEVDRINAARMAAIQSMKNHEAGADTLWFPGTTWLYERKPSITIQYLPNGIAKGNTWNGPGTWSLVNENTIVQQEPGGNPITVTFSADHQAALWQNQTNGEVHYAVAMEPAAGK